MIKPSKQRGGRSLSFFWYDEWPKSVTPSPSTAKIGYLFVSAIAMTPGCHLIRHRGPPPDAGHISVGYTRLWLLNSRKKPIFIPPYPKMTGNTGSLRPKAHTFVIPVHALSATDDDGHEPSVRAAHFCAEHLTITCQIEYQLLPSTQNSLPKTPRAWPDKKRIMLHKVESPQ